MERLRHDVAWATALQIVRTFDLPDEEKRAAFVLVYERVKAGLLAYDKETQALLRRLKPLSH